MPTDRNLPHLSRRGVLNASAAGLAAAATAGLFQAFDGTGAAAASSNAAPASRHLADAVLEAFKSHQLVGLGEVHNFQQHHDALGKLLTDPRLPDVVDDIVVEFGDAFYQPMMDKFILAGEPVNNADLRLAWRNTTTSPLSTWDEPVYEQFYRTVRAANWALPPSKRMRVLLGDPPINWPKITKPSQIPSLPSRDTHPASVVEKQVLAKGRRALLCYGMAHLFHNPPQLHMPPSNMVSLVEQHTGHRVYVVADLVPFAGDPAGIIPKLSPCPRDTVIPAAGTWLGSIAAAFIAQVLFRPHHGHPYDPLCAVPAESIIDAGLYVGVPPNITQSYWNPAIFLDPTYWAELQRRNALQGNLVNLNSYRQEQPAPLPLIKATFPANCGQPAQSS